MEYYKINIWSKQSPDIKSSETFTINYSYELDDIKYGILSRFLIDNNLITYIECINEAEKIIRKDNTMQEDTSIYFETLESIADDLLINKIDNLVEYKIIKLK